MKLINVAGNHTYATLITMLSSGKEVALVNQDLAVMVDHKGNVTEASEEEKAEYKLFRIGLHSSIITPEELS